MQKLKVEKSAFPGEEGTHLVVLYSNTKYGRGFRRLFKGSYKECQKYKKDLESEHEGNKKLQSVL